jgi:very long chain acyl-CoA dehydrogenase
MNLCSVAGIQFAGAHLKELQKAFKNPAANLGLIVEEATKRAFRSVGLGSSPSLSEHVHPNLVPAAALAAKVSVVFLSSSWRIWVDK